MIPRIADDFDDVIANILRFPAVLDGSLLLQGRLPSFHVWYAWKGRDGWLFGPSKFIGYHALGDEAYLANAREMDGRVTEAHLDEWFADVEARSPLGQQLKAELNRFLAKYGKNPRKSLKIRIATEGQQAGSAPSQLSAIARLVIEVANSLNAAERNEIRARLR